LGEDGFESNLTNEFWKKNLKSRLASKQDAKLSEHEKTPDPFSLGSL